MSFLYFFVIPFSIPSIMLTIVKNTKLLLLRLLCGEEKVIWSNKAFVNYFYIPFHANEPENRLYFIIFLAKRLKAFRTSSEIKIVKLLSKLKIFISSSVYNWRYTLYFLLYTYIILYIFIKYYISHILLEEKKNTCTSVGSFSGIGVFF